MQGGSGHKLPQIPEGTYCHSVENLPLLNDRELPRTINSPRYGKVPAEKQGLYCPFKGRRTETGKGKIFIHKLNAYCLYIMGLPIWEVSDR